MAIEHDLDTPLAAAVRAAKSQSAFARIIGRSQSYVHGLLRDGKQLRAEEALKAEKSTGVSRHELNPEAYPREVAPSAAATDARFEHAL